MQKFGLFMKIGAFVCWFCFLQTAIRNDSKNIEVSREKLYLKFTWAFYLEIISTLSSNRKPVDEVQELQSL